MADYIVPVKCVVSWNGQNYGAGDRVPGYTPPAAEKPEKQKEPTKAAEGTVKNGRVS